jgi:hypothetical protein
MMSKTVIADIRDSRFPDISIEPDSFVVWRNLDPYVHSAETLPNSSYYFNAGPMFPGGLSSPVFFRRPGQFEYICRFHMGMTGIVYVADRARESEHHGQPGEMGGHVGHNGHDHLKHFHGFVTGGRSGERLFMTHTPVIADERHHFQVILQGRLVEPKHVAAYDRLRESAYGSGKVQIFHDHLSLADIGSGAVKLLPESSFEFYPDGIDSEGKDVPGLEQNIPVQIDKVLHFHTFEPDSDYPEGLAYLMYGDVNDIFVDHYITRAPNFHSVAKLRKRPDFWTEREFSHALHVLIPSKRIREVSPKLLERVAFVDNAFHVIWLPPSGIYLAPPGHPQDPLIPRDGSPPTYDVILENGTKGQMEIERWLHFDVRLLNYGVLIT